VIARTSRAEIRRLVDARVPGMTAHDRDEMAIPSYLHWNPLIRWLMWRRYEVVAELAELAPGAHVLEFGCGIGLFLPTLAARAGTVYAIDRFPQFAKAFAASRGLPVTFVDSVEPVADATLDTIVAADVMEHLDAPREWAALFRRKLVPGGRLVVSGPTETPIYQLGRIAAGFAGRSPGCMLVHECTLGRHPETGGFASRLSYAILLLVTGTALAALGGALREQASAFLNARRAYS
jgi:2-polyprenyl-3-methyl-5-hydroxy-6-metoxy-1,4-benzoquinol methylase